MHLAMVFGTLSRKSCESDKRSGDFISETFLRVEVVFCPQGRKRLASDVQGC
jgi:hypothetical protein